MTKYFKLTGTVAQIDDLVHIERSEKPDLFKKTLTIETEDGQVLFPEVRNSKLKDFEKISVEVGSKVEIEYSFQGSFKNNKKYNNIFINKITKI